MATLWLREYESMGESSKGKPVPIAMEPGHVNPTPVTFTTSAQSAAFAGRTRYIGIIGSVAFHYLVGSNPTATTSHLKVPADTLIYIGVRPGDKIAAVEAA